jgi:hypothetical protein
MPHTSYVILNSIRLKNERERLQDLVSAPAYLREVYTLLYQYIGNTIWLTINFKAKSTDIWIRWIVLTRRSSRLVVEL